MLACGRVFGSDETDNNKGIFRTLLFALCLSSDVLYVRKCSSGSLRSAEINHVTVWKTRA